MIDDEETFRRFGYRECDLKPKSHKKVVVICDFCGDRKDLSKDKYTTNTERNSGDYRCKECSIPRGKESRLWKDGEVIKICEYCNKEYGIKSSRAEKSRFCSMKCRNDYDSKYKRGKNSPSWKKPLKKTCEYCGKIFDVPHHRKTAARFCSQKCSAKWHSGEHNSAWKPKIIKICKQCGKEHEKRPFEKDRPFCSKECYDEWQRKSQHTAGENSPRWVPKVEMVCGYCGKEFEVKPSIVATTKFCSMECRNKYDSVYKRGENAPRYKKRHTKETREKMSGSNHYNWKGGITAWHKRFTQTIAYKNWRKAIFERDDYTCQMCRIRGGRLQAHHIRPVRNNKNNLLLFDINNGITLCKKCHLEVNGREKEFESLFDMMIQGSKIEDNSD